MRLNLKNTVLLKSTFLIAIFINCAINSFSQSNKAIAIARNFNANSQMDSAIKYYQIAYEEAPFELKIYQEYFDYLIDHNQFDKAIELNKYMQEIRRNDPAIQMDLANIYLIKGDKKNYQKIIDQLIQDANNLNDFDLRKLANTFQQKGLVKSAIKILEISSEKIKRMGSLERELMYLYVEDGQYEKAFPLLIELLHYQPGVDNELKSRLIIWLDKDSKNKINLEKYLKKQSSKNSDYQYVYVNFLTWLTQLGGTSENALSTLINMDKKNPGSMAREIYNLGIDYMFEKQFQLSKQAFQYLTQLNNENNYVQSAEKSLIRVSYMQLTHQRPIQKSLIDENLTLMGGYFRKHPENVTNIEYLWYMDVLGKYNQQPEIAIQKLDSVLTNARVSKEYMGLGKLALGDYQILNKQVWEANLTYAQVSKLFRQDAYGEEARFKQAKLAFYRGDFIWAQTQLNILKASTTELISNDAMQLSIMITENTYNDSASLPLQLYAQADLMIFQFQYPKADSILSLLIEKFPEHELMDDVYMLKANMAKEEGRFQEAIQYYNLIIDKYNEDVLIDDAMIQAAYIHQNHLGEKDKAKAIYEDLILNYSNSTLSNVARQRLAELNKAGT